MENPLLPSGWLWTSSKALHHVGKDTEGETKAVTSLGGSADPSASRQHPASIPKIGDPSAAIQPASKS